VKSPGYDTLSVSKELRATPMFDPRNQSTPIYDKVARMFLWDPRVDGAENSPSNRRKKRSRKKRK